ncbi:MAG: chemotaxis protein CheX [Deltaproteobacteria bacterium]|nr:MAG: chemotaxis protein CheX [Deltaproteobacteria bacterium]
MAPCTTGRAGREGPGRPRDRRRPADTSDDARRGSHELSRSRQRTGVAIARRPHPHRPGRPMSSLNVPLAQWRAAVEVAAREIATYALSLPGAVVQDPVGIECTAKMIGAHIPLVGCGQGFDLALLSSPEGCRALSRAILGRPEAAVLRDSEIADAVGEIVNMLAGSVKRRLAGQRTELVLGLPIFIHGHLQPSDRMLVTALPTRFGPIDTIVLIAGQRG